MSIKNMYNEGKPVLIPTCEFDNTVDNILENDKMEHLKTDTRGTTNIVVTKYADPATDILDVESSLELDQKGKIIQVELVPSSHLQNIQNKNLAKLLNKTVIRKISKRKVDGAENKTSSDNEEKKSETCSVCGKEMLKNHELICKASSEFSERVNTSEPVMCSKCGKQFASMSVLKKHIASCKMHSLNSPLCSKCGKHFSSNYNLKRHMTSCKLCPDDEKSPRYMCQCGRTYSQEWDMKKHKLKCKEGKKKCKPCLVPSCSLLFYHKAQLIAHMKKDHNVKIQDPEVLNFSCFEDFLSWKEREEEETYTYYSKQTGSNVSGVSVNTYYVCQHDGSDRTHTSTPRKTERRNKKGRMKTGRLCWSQMNVKQFKDGTVKVTYFPSHTHPLSIADTEHHPLPSSVTMEIKRQLSELKSEPDDMLSDENQDVKKSRKRQYGMTLRTLRALARKNRSLFRITAEAVQKTDAPKIEIVEEKPNIPYQTKHGTVGNNNFMQLLVPEEENVDDPEEMHCEEETKHDITAERRNEALRDSFDQLNELKGVLESDKLDLTTIDSIRDTLKTLVMKCKTVQEVPSLTVPKTTQLQDMMVYQPQSPLPSTEIFPLQNEENGNSTELNSDIKRLVSTPEKTVYQIIPVDNEEKSTNEYLYQNGVELVGAREFIIIAGDHAQYFQSVNPDVQYDLN